MLIKIYVIIVSQLMNEPGDGRDCGKVFHSFVAEGENKRSNSADPDLRIDNMRLTWQAMIS